MPGLFSQAIAAFQGFFSRGFWFGSFLPVAMFAALNVLLARIAGFDWAKGLTSDVTSDKWIWATPACIALIVLAYALAPMVPLCRALLDGRRLPNWLFESLRGQRMVDKAQALERVISTIQYITMTDALTRKAGGILGLARALGDKRGTAKHHLRSRLARFGVVWLRRRVARGAVPDVTVLRRTIGCVILAFHANSASLDPELRGLDARVLELLTRASDNAKDRLVRLRGHYDKLPREVQPTSIGDARNRSELYSQTVYNVEFAWIWPRVQMVISETDAATKRIEAVRALNEFATLSLVLTIASLAVWPPILMLRGAAWTFLAVGAFGPALVRFFFQLVVESQVSLGETAQGIVDKFRFELLKALHIKPPMTLSGEREIWSRLAAVAGGEKVADEIVWTAP